MAGRSERNWKPKARFHVGDVSIVNNTVYLGLTQVHGLRKVTMFDDACVPPRLIREDYSIRQLRKMKAKLPPVYTDMNGNIVNLAGETVMEGPR